MKKRFGIFSIIIILCVAFTVISVAFANDDASVARIGETYYSSLQSALKAAGAGDTVVLLKDADARGLQLNKSITVDLNGAELIYDTAVNHLVKDGDNYIFAQHELDQYEAQEPSCTESGWKAYVFCSVCNYTDYEEKPAKGHHFSDTVKPATCTEKGYTTHSCTDCEYSYVDSYVDALGHDLVHNEAKASTCKEHGWAAYDNCSRCDYSTIVELPFGEHSFVDMVTPPDCTHDGYTTHICSVCGTSSVDSYVPSLGHDVIPHDAQAPDCVTAGCAAYDTCSRCDYSTYAEIPALGHDLVHYDGEAPGCTEPGYYAYEICARCEYSSFEEIPATGHSYVSTVTPAGCLVGGYTTHVCSKCLDTYVDSETKPLGHSIIHHAAVSPGCETAGNKAYDTCARCDYTTYAELPPLGHDILINDPQAPGCDTVGWEQYETCTRCDYSTYVELPALGHNYTSDITPPDCTNIGYTTHVCTRCTDSYVDTYVPALGHDLTHYEGNAPSCTDPGWNAYDICSRCEYSSFEEIPATGHSYVSTVTPAGCLVGGYTTHVCSKCLDTYVDSETEALGHSIVHHDAAVPGCETAGNEAYDTCTRCEYTTYVEIPAIGHKYLTSVIKPDCTNKGYTLHSCTRCTSSYKDNYIPALGHDLIHYGGNPPTCTEIGWNDYDICSRCEYSSFSEIPATGHHYDGTLTPPGCLEGGYTSYQCRDCESSYVSDYTEALGHDIIHHEEKEPTCSEPGWDAYDTCSRCDYTTYVEIPASGHDYVPTVTPPNCTEQGYTTYICRFCEDSYVSDYTEPLGHDFVDHEAKAPDCENVGWEAYKTCTRCDYCDKLELSPPGHNMDIETVPPSCTTDGYTLHFCTRCEYAYTDELINALGHDIVRHEAKDSTCSEVGWYEYYTCTRCDYTTYEEIPLSDHEYGDPSFSWNGHLCTAAFKCHCGAALPVDCTIIEEVTLEPSCTSPGEMTYTAIASYNDAEYSIYKMESIPATGHIYNTPQFNWTDNYRCTGRMVCKCGQTVPASCSLTSSITKTPTCAEEGVRTYKATITYGGKSYVDTNDCPLDTVAHTPLPSVTENRIEPKCTTDGSYEEVSYCEVCGKEVSRVRKSIQALGHNLIHHEAKDATCSEQGWFAYDSCSRCDYNNMVSIPETGHIYNDVVTAPTCAERGYTTRTCKVCKYSFRSSYVDELGHQFGEPQFVWENDCSAANAVVNCTRCGINTFSCTITANTSIAPTCTQKGSRTYVASVVINDELMSDVKSETIPEKGHSYEMSTVAPSCTRGGYTIYTCSSCGASKTSDYVKATGHQYTDIVVASTCTEQGYTTHTCVCGDTYTDSYTSALGHKYKNGVCTRCGDGTPVISAPSVTVSNVASSGKIKLTWKAVNNAVKYEIWRAASKSGTYSKLYTTTNTYYTNTSAKAGSTYYYKVRALNDDGLSGDFSSVVSRVCDCACPVVKTSNVASSGKIKLTWEAVDGASKYEIWRATSKSGTYTKLYTTSNTSYTNTSANAGYTYYYKIKALSSKTTSADSAYSDIVSRTCDLERVTAKITLSSGHPKISWTKLDGASKYEIWRATSKTGTYTKIYTTTSTSYVNTGAKYGTTYYYKVIAVSSKTSSANSAYSSPVSITAK